MNPPLGFLGLGAMGQPMAANLLAQGHTLRIWNRDSAKGSELVAAGAIRAATPASAAEPGGIVISMLADDRALLDISAGPDGLVGRLGAGGVHVSCSTVAGSTLDSLAARHAEHGEVLVAAPVFGRPEAALARKLWVLMAGPQPARARVAPILAQLGQRVVDLGETLAAAAAMKLAGNFMILAAIESMGEAMLLAERHGVARETFAEFFGQSLFACPIYQNYGRQIATRRYRPAGFRLPLGLKDIRLVQDTAAQVNLPMPLADLLRNRLMESVSRGRSELDWTALELSIANAAGSEPEITSGA
jgi:3-hydroxyisobutyrate dehydrogenase-like beta-hydroxyacid dehydrogenase